MQNTSKSFTDLTKSLNKPHLVYDDIHALMAKLSHYDNVSSQQVGESYNGQAINLISLGHGPITIFAWTQMHGDEATASAAVFDWLNILLHKQHASHALSDYGLKQWESRFTVHILPMLNPDGAYLRTRENAQGMDINRDALALQSPEAKILMRLSQSLKPHIAFNLHDQSSDYRCGNTNNHSTIAFLAPAFDEQESVDSSRQKAMQIIASMYHKLQAYIPQCVARYEAQYSALCFGDTIAGMQVSTILIESGSAENDPNRQVAREMNVVSLLEAMRYLMAETNVSTSEDDVRKSIRDYFNIPQNTLP